LKDQMGVKRFKVVYPEDGSVVKETKPGIAVDASALETPVDPKTVVLTLNGTDVTADADINAAYILYDRRIRLIPAPMKSE